jgi:hypothetical protein
MIGIEEEEQTKQDGDPKERGLMRSDQDPSRSSHRRYLTPTVLSIRRERSFAIDGVVLPADEASNAATSSTHHHGGGCSSARTDWHQKMSAA